MRQYAILFGALLAIIPAIWYYNFISKARETQPFRVAYVLKHAPEDDGSFKTYLAGQTLDGDADVARIRVSEDTISNVPGAILAPEGEDASDYEIGVQLTRPLTQDVPAGSILQENFFIEDPRREFEMQIDPGHRAFSIPVNEDASVGGFVEPGSLVDIYQQPVVNSLDRVVKEAKIIVGEVRVLAVGTYFNRREFERAGRPTYSSVTVELTPEQISDVLLSRQVAGDQVTLSLYNPCTVDDRSFGCN